MKLSIITINYNDATGLKKTLDSVAKQTSCNFEHIIIDGASTDGSVEVIREYESTLASSLSPFASRLKWLSEPDKGIYNAMNKGIKMTTGEYLLFLNSGDCLVDNEVVEYFVSCDNTEDIISGGTLLGYEEQRQKFPPAELTFELFVHDSLMHAATFIKRNLFEKYGLYNENHRIVSDWEFFVKVLINNNCSYAKVDRLISLFDTTGISNQTAHSELHIQERNEVINSMMAYLKPVYDELMEKRKICNEYQFLKNGRMGWIVRMCLKLKSKVKK